MRGIMINNSPAWSEAGAQSPLPAGVSGTPLLESLRGGLSGRHVGELRGTRPTGARPTLEGPGVTCVPGNCCKKEERPGMKVVSLVV